MMKNKNQRAFVLAGLWTVLAAGLFISLSYRPTGFDLDVLIFGTIIFIPIQFISGFGYSRLTTWFNRKKQDPNLFNIKNKIILFIAKFNRDIKCQDCTKKPAEFRCKMTDTTILLCPDCLSDNIEGFHTGGGYTVGDFKKIARIRPPQQSPNVGKS